MSWIGTLYWVVFAAGWLQLRRAGMRTGQPVRVTGWSLAVWLTVAIASGLQFIWPDLLSRGMRDSTAIGNGEWWRLFTAMFFQDGGWLGTFVNLLTLAVTMVVAGAIVRGWVLVVLFVVGGVVCNLLTMLIFPQPGAGNSMATLLLVVVVAVWSMHRDTPDLVIAAVFVAVAVVLVLTQNPHGLAVAAGLVLGFATKRLESLARPAGYGGPDDSPGR